MPPALLRSSRALPLLSVAAVGLTMAALTGAVFGAMFGGSSVTGEIAAIAGLPTLAVGTAWAALLRWRRTVGRRQLPLGWLLSVPLAALDAALVAGVLGGLKGDHVDVILGALMGLTIGVIFWGPAMLAVLVVFGLPIVWSQRQARRGLEGAERGEVVVGLVCAVLSFALLVALAVTRQDVWVLDIGSTERNVQVSLPLLRAGQVGAITVAILSALGLLAGGATTALAASRSRQRRQLIEAAESGARPDYRVEHTPAGRVLIRVRPASADDYRQADADEESFALEQELSAPSARSSP